MRTKLLLPLAALAILATALPASAHEPIDAKADMVSTQPFLTDVGDRTYVFIRNPHGGLVLFPYDIIPVEPNVATPPEAPTDIEPRGPQHL